MQMPKPMTLPPERKMKVEDIVRPKIVMSYGESGSGKTVFASTFPAPQVWLDLDVGIDSIAWAIKEGICPHDLEKDFTFWTPDETSEDGKRPVGFWQCAQKINEWLAKPSEWNTLVIDPLSTVNAFAMAASMEVTGTVQLVQSKEGKFLSESWEYAKKAGVVIPMIQDYRPAQSFVQKFVDPLKLAAKQYKKWIIFTCQQYETYKSTGIGSIPVLVSLEPQLFGQQRKSLVGSIDEVYYMRVKKVEGKRAIKIQTVKDGTRICKSRFGCLDELHEPNYAAIRKSVRKYYGVDLNDRLG